MRAGRDAHLNAHPTSRLLCDALLRSLQSVDAHVIRKPNTPTWCPLQVEGHGAFAQVQHFVRLGKIRVWCTGDADRRRRAAAAAGLHMNVRSALNTGWARKFPGHFEITEPDEAVRLAAVLLDARLPDAVPRLPEEVPPAETWEGAKEQIVVNRYERDPRARAACLDAHGHRCAVCELDFGSRYGEIGRGYIHVHHITPLASIGTRYRINGRTDLVPVCPNCHAMLHRREPPFTVDELRAQAFGGRTPS